MVTPRQYAAADGAHALLDEPEPAFRNQHFDCYQRYHLPGPARTQRDRRLGSGLVGRNRSKSAGYCGRPSQPTYLTGTGLAHFHGHVPAPQLIAYRLEHALAISPTRGGCRRFLGLAATAGPPALPA